MNTMIKSILVSLTIALLCSCGTVGEKQDIAVAEPPPELVPTLQFIPTLESDPETGEQLAYQPVENPYLVVKGKLNKTSVEQYIEARRAFKAEQWQQAETLLKTLIESDKALSGPWVMRGDIALATQQNDDALGFYQQAIEINPDNINAYLRLAKLHRIRGEFLQAQNIYAEALTIWPDFPEAHLNLGVLYDIYLNMPLRAQKHMEAYQLLTNDNNAQVGELGLPVALCYCRCQ